MTLIKAIIINDDISTDQMLLCKMHVGSKMKFRKHAFVIDFEFEESLVNKFKILIADEWKIVIEKKIIVNNSWKTIVDTCMVIDGEWKN